MSHFWVEGPPKAQPRPRRSKNGGVYNPPTTNEWKKKIIIEAKKWMHSAKWKKPEPWEPLCVNVTFLMPRPKTRERDEYHVIKPDRDNLDKAILDALKKAGVYHDDCQVCDGRIQKNYIQGDNGRKTGGVYIDISRIADPQF